MISIDRANIVRQTLNVSLYVSDLQQAVLEKFIPKPGAVQKLPHRVLRGTALNKKIYT
ncbi:hypothetical protein Mapa_008027 [Marchantia paleacea]|nr:hypothetical protein Mapa_008027 [Marchantia paleacea]